MQKQVPHHTGGRMEEKSMAKVGILMGSDSDLPIMKKADEMLEKFGIE